MLHRAGWAASIAAMLTLLALGGASIAPAPRTAGAAHAGLHLPAPAGTQWEIAGGYNTATHSAPNPHELDIVRVDGPTAGTPVLASMAGRVAYIESGCMTIRDSGVALLMCHLFPDSTLRVGQWLRLGDRVGEVAPAGYARNNGLSHIHIAVHRDNNGYFGNTIPLAGQWAIEGHEFPTTSAFNAYRGTRIVSTNGSSTDGGGASAIAPATTGSPPTDGGTPATVTAPALAGPGGIPTLQGFRPSGIGLMVVREGGSTEALLVAMRQAGAPVAGCTVASVVRGRWVILIAGAPAAVNAAWRATYPSGVPAFVALYTRCP